MIKTEVTKKQIRKSYKNIIGIGYCQASNLLKGQDARYYSSGIYGWTCDYYEINNSTIISTGYSPIDTIKANYETVKKYEDKARNIFNNYNLKYDVKIKKVNKLLNKFIIDTLEKETK